MKMTQFKNLAKWLSIALLAGCMSTAAFAQDGSSAGAAQRTNLKVGDVIAIGLVNGSGDLITMFFPGMDEMMKGLETPKQNLVVKTNQHFKVFLTTTSGTFRYDGEESQAPVPLNGILKVKVEDNQTGGIALTDYNSISTAPVTLISNGNYGDNQAFTVRFKATPGLQLPPGIYEVNVLYTATPM